MAVITTMLVVGMLGCVAELESVFVPTVDTSFILGTTPLVDTVQRDVMDGVYTVDAAQSDVARFGSAISLRLDAQGIVSMYATQGIHYFVLQGGLRNDSAVFVGRWRSINSASAGTINLVVLPSEGGSDLARGKTPTRMIARCVVRTGNGPEQDLVLIRSYKLTDDVKNFQIIAHRGGGRNSERLGVSENSVEMIRLAPLLGATGVEIDVLVTKDGVPIVFHDPTLTPRTVQGSYLLGEVSSYTYAQLKQHVRLVNGEQIPTLEEALKAVIEDTPLQLVWLDVKTPTVLDDVMRIQYEAQQQASSQRRNVTFLLGIPAADILQAFRRSTYAQKASIRTLCELDPAVVNDIDADVWAPRFTNGIQRSEAESMRDSRRDVFVWTLDDPVFMDSFLRERYRNGLLYNGVLTNYPTLLASIFYASKAQQ